MLSALASRETAGLRKRRRHDHEACLLTPPLTTLLSTCEVADEHGEGSIPYSLSFSKSGALISVSSEDGCIRLLDTSAELPSTTSTDSTTSWQAHDNAVFYSSFIKDDSCLLSCSGDATIGLWDVGTQEQMRRLTYHRQSVKLVAVLPSCDGSIFCSGSRDGSLALWDLRVPGTSPISTVDGAHAQAMLSKRVTKKLTARSITGLAFLPGTSLLVSSGAGDTTVKTWDTRMLMHKKRMSASELCSFSCRGSSGGPFGITSLALSPDGSRLLANSTDSKLYMMSSTHSSLSPPLAVFNGHHSPPGDHSFYISCGWSSDESSIGAGSLDNAVYIWNARRPDLSPSKLVSDFPWPAREAFGMCFNPIDPSQVATISDNSTIRIWRLGLPNLALPHTPSQASPISFTDATPEALIAPRDLPFASSCLLVASRGQQVVQDLDFECIPLEPGYNKENVDPTKGADGGVAVPSSNKTPFASSSIKISSNPVPLRARPQGTHCQAPITNFFKR
jgi:WD40 repeat protein